jgi:hypothetical protein
MVQFNTQKRKLDPYRVEQAVSKTVSYVKNWQLTQIRNLIADESAKTPICVEIDANKIMVGRYVVVNKEGFWYVYRLLADKPDYSFSSKKTAIAYILCRYKGRNKLSEKILKADYELILHRSNLVEYNYNYTKAVKNKDQFKISFYLTMIEESEIQINNAKTILQKSLNLAKYFNIWEY